MNETLKQNRLLREQGNDRSFSYTSDERNSKDLQEDVRFPYNRLLSYPRLSCVILISWGGCINIRTVHLIFSSTNEWKNKIVVVILSRRNCKCLLCVISYFFHGYSCCVTFISRACLKLNLFCVQSAYISCFSCCCCF